MTWSNSYIHSNTTDFIYIKPKPITAAPGWSSSVVLGTQNLAYNAEWVFSGLTDGVDYVVFHRLTGFVLSTDTVIGELKYVYPVDTLLEPVTDLLEEIKDLLEADVVTEMVDDVLVIHTYQRGTETELIPDKTVKQTSGDDLTNPATQLFGGAQEP